MAAKSASVLDVTKLMDLPVSTLEGMKTLYEGTANAKIIEFAILHHSAKPSPAKPVAEKPVVVAPPKVYVQRVEVYRGRCRIKGGICREQIDNVIAQLQALKGNPSVLTYADCQTQFPWDKDGNKPA